MFKGSFTALITPFKAGKVDEDAFARFVEWQIKEGTHGLVPCGTTGESPTLSTEEHKRVIALDVHQAKISACAIIGEPNHPASISAPAGGCARPGCASPNRRPPEASRRTVPPPSDPAA